MKKKLYTAIGLMSGTSMDGIDLSIISSDGYDEISNVLDDLTLKERYNSFRRSFGFNFRWNFSGHKNK